MLLREFKGEKGFEVAAKAMPLIMIMRDNAKTREAWVDFVNASKADKEKADTDKGKKKNPEKEAEIERNMSRRLYTYLSTMLLNEREAAIELFALLNDIDVDKFEYDCASILDDMINAVAYDETLMRLFIKRTPKKAAQTSGSVSENTEAAET